MNLKEMLRRSSESLGDKTAVSLGSRRLSYRELDRDSSKIARTLRRLGVERATG